MRQCDKLQQLRAAVHGGEYRRLVLFAILCRAGLQRSIAGLPYDGPADPFSASAVRGHDSSKNGTVFSA